MEEEDKNGNEERSSLARSHAFATDGGRWRTDRNLAAAAPPTDIFAIYPGSRPRPPEGEILEHGQGTKARLQCPRLT